MIGQASEGVDLRWDGLLTFKPQKYQFYSGAHDSPLTPGPATSEIYARLVTYKRFA